MALSAVTIAAATTAAPATGMSMAASSGRTVTGTAAPVNTVRLSTGPTTSASANPAASVIGILILLVIAGAALAVAVRLLTVQREPEAALPAARGASRRQPAARGITEGPEIVLRPKCEPGLTTWGYRYPAAPAPRAALFYTHLT
jgi:hypothetical protein